MLDLWRLMRADEPLRLDCTLTRTDGIDLDSQLEAEMRAWYLSLLDFGPEEFNAIINAAAKASVTTHNNLTVISAPDEVRRILSLKFSNWPAPVKPSHSACLVKQLADNPFCTKVAAACINPRTIIVCGDCSNQLTELNCTVDLGDDMYSFDDSALQQIVNSKSWK